MRENETHGFRVGQNPRGSGRSHQVRVVGNPLAPQHLHQYVRPNSFQRRHHRGIRYQRVQLGLILTNVE